MLEEFAGREDIAALELRDAFGVQPERSLALRRGLGQRGRTGPVGWKRLQARGRLQRGGRRGGRYGEHHRRLRQDLAFDTDKRDGDVRLALLAGGQDDRQRRQGEEGHGPGSGRDRISFREGRGRRQAANSHEAVLWKRAWRADLNGQPHAGSRFRAHDRGDADGGSLRLLRVG